MPVAELDRVPGVVPAVIARDRVEAFREEIDELAFPLVSPLSSEDGERLNAIAGHGLTTIADFFGDVTPGPGERDSRPPAGRPGTEVRREECPMISR